MKINLEQEEKDALETMSKSGANYVVALKKVFNEALKDLENIRNIDPKSNMGLQTLARQLACEMVVDMRDAVFGPEQKKNIVSEQPPRKRFI